MTDFDAIARDLPPVITQVNRVFFNINILIIISYIIALDPTNRQVVVNKTLDPLI